MSVGNYQASLTIDGFKGVMQFDDNESINTDMRYAADGKNFDTRDGTLLPLASPLATTPTIPCVTGSAGVLIRAPYASDTWPAQYGLGHDIIVVGGTQAVSGETTRNIVYLLTPGKTSFVRMPSTEVMSVSSLDTIDLLSTRWSFAQYQMERAGSIGDWLFHSNTKFGLAYFRLPAGTSGNWGFSYDSVTPLAPYKFGVIARYGERLWGAGIEEHGDLLCYSAPYNPLDWEQNTQIPEDGAGEILQPTFDGENFTALVPFGNSLLAFKEHSLWRVTGMSPDEFTFQEQYGTGTIYPNTICVYQEAVYFLTDRGVCRYDGVTVRPFQSYALRTYWRDHPLRGIDTLMPTATVWRDRYILSFPTSTEDTYNKVTVVYDFADGAWRFDDKNLYATAYITVQNKLFLLQPTEEGTTNVTEWHGSIEETETAALDDVTNFTGFDWLTPWTDMGAKDVLKTDYKLRFWIQTHMKAHDRLKLSVTMETERGSKTREIVFSEDVDEEVKLNFHVSGRKVRLRFKLTDELGNEDITSWCKIMGGVQINADTTPD